MEFGSAYVRVLYSFFFRLTGVSLSPHHNDARFIATSSADRSVKLWDRFDGAMPVCWSKRSRVTDIKWRRHWPGVLVCVEDVCALVANNFIYQLFITSVLSIYLVKSFF